MNNTRLLHVTDFHANDSWFEWLVSAAPSYGLVAFSGDLLDFNQHRAIGDQVDRVLAHMRKIHVPMALCSGNHDSLAGEGPRLHQAAWMRELASHQVWIDLDCFDFAGFHFRCIPWQGALPKPRLNEVWLHHAPPSGARTAFARGGCDFGDWALGEACRRGEGPQLLLGGHVHDVERHWARAGETTWSFNAGYAAGVKSPSFHTVDLARGIASCYNAATGESDLLRLW